MDSVTLLGTVRKVVHTSYGYLIQFEDASGHTTHELHTDHLDEAEWMEPEKVFSITIRPHVPIAEPEAPEA